MVPNMGPYARTQVPSRPKMALMVPVRDHKADLEGVDGTYNGTHIIYQVGTGRRPALLLASLPH